MHRNDLWANLTNETQEAISHDFIRLSQTLRTPSNIKHQLAVILEKCLKNENYKENAFANLIALVKNNEEVKKELSAFAANENKNFDAIRPLAEKVIKQTEFIFNPKI